IQGTVDNPANICVVVDAPDPDINGDGQVNAIDLAFILTYWGSSAPIADLNDDGIVGGADLTIVLSGWTG
ncbi:MAG: dockerin type I domain-containing protein, partial [bacterium]